MNRRRFLQIVSTAGGTVVVVELGSCGSNGGGGPGDAGVDGGAGADGGAIPGADAGADAAVGAGTTVGGSVDTAQIGGAGLDVQSAQQPHGAVTGGDFATTVSGRAPQLLFVTDAARKLRALAVVHAGDATVRIDARSTALATVFGSPGVLTVDPAPARARAAAITALPSFAPYVAYLAGKLPGTDLGALVNDAQFLALRDQVVTDLLAQGPLALATQAHGLFEGTYAPASAENKDQAQVTLGNAGWRFVAVARQELDAAGNVVRTSVPRLQKAQNPLPAQAPSLISGVNPVTWGNLFFMQAGTPGTAVDLVDASHPEVVRHVYWVVGPGTPVGSKTLPAAVQLSAAPPLLGTLVFYLLAPLLDLTGGGSAMLQFLGKNAKLTKVEELVASLSGTNLNTAGLSGALSSGDLGNVRAALMDLGGALVGLGPAFLTAAGIAEAPEALLLLGTFLAVSAGVFGLFNLSAFTSKLLAAPAVTSVEVPLTPAPKFSARALNQDVLSNGNLSINTLGHVLYTRLQVTGPTTSRFVPVLLKTESDTRVELGDYSAVAVSNLNVLDHYTFTVNHEDSSVSTFLWDGTARDLGQLDSGTTPRTTSGAINDSDTVVAFAQATSTQLHLCLWKDQPGFKLKDLGVVTHAAGFPSFAINNKGQMACRDASDGGVGAKLVMLSESDPPRVVADTGGNAPSTFALNDAGQIAYTGSDGLVHLWDDGTDTVLSPPPTVSTDQPLTVFGMNNHGWVLAQGAVDAAPFTTLVLWVDGTPYDLRDLVDLPPELDALTAGMAALNDVGQIVTIGRGKSDTGPSSLVLLTPKK